MAPLGHVELTKMQNLLKSKNNQNVKNKMKTKPKIRLYFHFRFCCHFGFHFRFCFFYFRFSFCFYFRFCFCFIFLYILSLNFTMARQGHYRYLCQKCLSSHSQNLEFFTCRVLSFDCKNQEIIDTFFNILVNMSQCLYVEYNLYKLVSSEKSF